MLVGRHLERRCGAALAKRKATRMQKRSEIGLTNFNKRDDANDSLCLLTPEVTQGPYHVLGELVRQNITQGQGILTFFFFTREDGSEQLPFFI